MLITAAYAQAAGSSLLGSSDTLVQLVPIVAMIAIVYFVLWRPQQRRAKEQREMVQAARRGDVVVTTGGLIGKVTKSVDDNEVEFEIAPNVARTPGPLRHLRSARQGRTGQGPDSARQVAAGQEGRAELLTTARRPAPGRELSPLLDRKPDAPFRYLEIGLRPGARCGCGSGHLAKLHAGSGG